VGATQILNFLGVFRNFFLLPVSFRILCFFSGKGSGNTEKYRIPLLICALILSVIQDVMYFGSDFSSIANKPLVVLYTWIMILAILGNGQVWLSFTNKFCSYMNRTSFLNLYMALSSYDFNCNMGNKMF
ncbi:MAG TPA: hypothetical protein GX706_04730, partial [Candidatus Moranbacteria bacterium]|nr:hypothetical protein [Candidatus Moranbacteria bacterium]